MLKRVETEPIVVLERSELPPERRRKEGNSLTTKGLMIRGQIRTTMHNADAVFFCEGDRVVRSERAGI